MAIGYNACKDRWKFNNRIVSAMFIFYYDNILGTVFADTLLHKNAVASNKIK